MAMVDDDNGDDGWQWQVIMMTMTMDDGIQQLLCRAQWKTTTVASDNSGRQQWRLITISDKIYT